MVDAWLILLTYALACARLTGLVVADDITRPLRDALLRRLDPARAAHHAVATLVSCAWCASIWLAAAVAPLWWWHGSDPWCLVPAAALAMSQLTGMVSDLGRR